MHRFFNTGIHEIAFSRFLICILAMVLIFFVGSLEELIRVITKSILPANYHLFFFETSLESSTMVSLMPILAVLPFSGTYIDGIRTKFVRLYLIRSSYLKYLSSCLFVTFLYGGGIFFCGGIMAFCSSFLLFFRAERITASSILLTQPLFHILMLLFMTGGVWAVMGLTISTFIENKYIAYASPFVIYYLLVILCERYLPNIFLLYPPNWTKPEEWPLGVWGAVSFLLELTLSLGMLFIIQAGRRLQEL